MSAFTKRLPAALLRRVSTLAVWFGFLQAASLLYAASLTNTVQFNLTDIVQGNYTNRPVTVRSISTPRTNPPYIAINYMVSTNSGTAGQFTLTNLIDGTYEVSVLGIPNPTVFKILVPTNQGAAHLAADLLTTNIDVNATTAWTRAQADGRFVLRSNGSATNLSVSNINFSLGNTNIGTVFTRGTNGLPYWQTNASGGGGGTGTVTNVTTNGPGITVTGGTTNAVLALNAALQTLSSNRGESLHASNATYLLAGMYGDELAVIGTNSGFRLYLAHGSDARHYGLFSDHGVYRRSGESIRDPSIIRRNGRWFLAHTVAFSPGSGYTNLFRIAASDNLNTWTNHHNFWSANTNHFLWAPEFFQDTDGSLYILYVVDGGSIWATKASDETLTNWNSPTEIVLAGHAGATAIDPFMVRTGAVYNLFFKSSTSNNIWVATSTNATNGFTCVLSNDWAGWGIDREGISVVSVSNGWLATMDRNVYTAAYDNEPSTAWSFSGDGWATWTALSPVMSGNISMHHGTVLMITNIADQMRVANAAKAAEPRTNIIMGAQYRPGSGVAVLGLGNGYLYRNEGATGYGAIGYLSDTWLDIMVYSNAANNGNFGTNLWPAIRINDSGTGTTFYTPITADGSISAPNMAGAGTAVGWSNGVLVRTNISGGTDYVTNINGIATNLSVTNASSGVALSVNSATGTNIVARIAMGGTNYLIVRSNSTSGKIDTTIASDLTLTNLPGEYPYMFFSNPDWTNARQVGITQIDAGAATPPFSNIIALEEWAGGVNVSSAYLGLSPHGIYQSTGDGFLGNSTFPWGQLYVTNGTAAAGKMWASTGTDGKGAWTNDIGTASLPFANVWVTNIWNVTATNSANVVPFRIGSSTGTNNLFEVASGNTNFLTVLSNGNLLVKSDSSLTVPSVKFSGNTNTGFNSFPATDIISVISASSESTRFSGQGITIATLAIRGGTAFNTADSTIKRESAGTWLLTTNGVAHGYLSATNGFIVGTTTNVPTALATNQVWLWNSNGAKLFAYCNGTNKLVADFTTP